MGVWLNDRVEIIANDMGNRTTPSYVAFSDTERCVLIEAAFFVCCTSLHFTLCIMLRVP